ncbi:DUF192 domain-containing protein [Arhodomonas sp. AD133]|uniref:DUF192 domain-containing protein n=1 Tax=Arhodomonas sp. AD133 TaxID=3415009 RepID=UPI003EB839DE
MRLYDVNGNLMLPDVRVAESFFKRARGLLFSRELGPGEGLLLRKCRSVHTVGMSFPIDVVFLDADGVVLARRDDLGPWRFAGCSGACDTLETASGNAEKLGLDVGIRAVFE